MNWRKRLELALIEFMMDETCERLIPFRQSLRRLCGARRSPREDAVNSHPALPGSFPVRLPDCSSVLSCFRVPCSMSLLRREEMKTFTLIELLIVVSIIAILAGMLLLGNLTFLLYDVLLGRIGDLYVYRLRPKIFPHHFS